MSSKSVVELEPLFAQVGECRQLFSERFGKDSKPYTPPVSQDIHSTHSHPDRSSMPALPVHVGDPAYTQQFCAQQQTLLTMVRVQACSHWSENVGFPSSCQSAVTMLVFPVQTHDWQGGSHASWAGRFCCSQRISSTRSVSAATNANFSLYLMFEELHQCIDERFLMPRCGTRPASALTN